MDSFHWFTVKLVIVSYIQLCINTEYSFVIRLSEIMQFSPLFSICFLFHFWYFVSWYQTWNTYPSLSKSNMENIPICYHLQNGDLPWTVLVSNILLGTIITHGAYPLLWRSKQRTKLVSWMDWYLSQVLQMICMNSRKDATIWCLGWSIIFRKRLAVA